MLRVLRDHDISQRRACMLVGVDPKTVRRDRAPDNPEVREEMKLIANKRRRFGYRRIGVLLERKGMNMNHKNLYRFYTEEKLGVRRRRGRKRARYHERRCRWLYALASVGTWILCLTRLAHFANSAGWL